MKKLILNKGKVLYKYSHYYCFLTLKVVKGKKKIKRAQSGILNVMWYKYFVHEAPEYKKYS